MGFRATLMFDVYVPERGEIGQSLPRLQIVEQRINSEA